MLVKAFELRNEFPFDMAEGRVFLDKERLIPTSLNRGTAVFNTWETKPSLGEHITLFGVTHAQNTMRMVVFSNGVHTRYYWFTRSRRHTYLVTTGSKDLDEAWENLFKAFMLDVRTVQSYWYDKFKHFTLEYLKTLGNKEFEFDLSGNWKGSLANIRVRKESFFNKQVTVTWDGQQRTCDFKKHPLLEFEVVSKVA